MNKKKLGMTIGSLALVGAIAVGGTLAYLTDTTSQVKNTFNVTENLSIKLDEQDYDNPDGDRVLQNQYDDMTPNQLYPKDPTVTLEKHDTDQYVFMALKKNDNIKITDLNTTDWELVETLVQEGGDVVVYRYKDIITSTFEDKELEINGVNLPSLFKNIRLEDKFTNEYIENLGNQYDLGNILVGAAAVQAKGLNNTYGSDEAAAEAYDLVKTGLLKLVGYTVQE